MRAPTTSDVVPLRPNQLDQSVLFLPDQLWNLLPAAAYVCDGPICSLPLTEPQALLDNLAQLR